MTNLKLQNEHGITISKRRTSEQLLLDNGPYAKLLCDLVVAAKIKGASDIHIEPTEAGVDFRLRIQGYLSTVLGDIKQVSNPMTFFLEQLIIRPILWYIEHKFSHISKPIFLNFLNILTLQNFCLSFILFLNLLLFLSIRLSCRIVDWFGR